MTRKPFSELSTISTKQYKKGEIIMEKNFEMPTLTMVVFENEDVITSSGPLFNLGNFSFPGFNPFGE